MQIVGKRHTAATNCFIALAARSVTYFVVQSAWPASCCMQRLDLTDQIGKLKVIHVAGTKGKVRSFRQQQEGGSSDGMNSHAVQAAHLAQQSVMHHAQGSTCAMVESVLRHAGYRTGLFTSPHLVDVRERIRLDGSDSNQ